MTLLLCLPCDDPSVGRVDKSSLPQQTLMELLTENITNREMLCVFPKVPTKIFEWVYCTRNNAEEVTEIRWSFMYLNGSIALQWLPPTIDSLALQSNSLSGTVDLTCLPDSLTYCSLTNNTFSGTINLTQLPAQMRYLYLGKNDFCGKTDLSQLPKSLRELDVSETQLEGEIFAPWVKAETEGSNVKVTQNK